MPPGAPSTLDGAWFEAKFWLARAHDCAHAQYSKLICLVLSSCSLSCSITLYYWLAFLFMDPPSVAVTPPSQSATPATPSTSPAVPIPPLPPSPSTTLAGPVTVPHTSASVATGGYVLNLDRVALAIGVSEWVTPN